MRFNFTAGNFPIEKFKKDRTETPSLGYFSGLLDLLTAQFPVLLLDHRHCFLILLRLDVEVLSYRLKCAMFLHDSISMLFLLLFSLICLNKG